jgi:sugar (pentulose or hexulose) kinase
MKFLALDLGTSFLKGAVLELEQVGISHISRTPFPAPVAQLPSRHVEVAPAAIVRATQTLLDQLAAAAPDAEGVVVTSQMHGIVLTNAQGKAISNAVTWQDQRILDPAGHGEGSYYDQLTEQLTPAAVAATGNGLKPSLPLCTLAWWAQKGILREGAVPASLPDYVLSTISHSPPVAEPTMAASMGLLDLATGDWHQEILRDLGLERLAWPRVADLSAPSYQLEIGGRKLPCYAPVGDHQCALVGALLQAGELSLNISTGSQLGVIAPTFLPGPYETRPYFDGAYLQAITRIPAGRALNALVALLTELAQAEGYSIHDPWATIAAAVEATPQTDMHMDISFFASPVGERGEMTNLSEENMQVGHLFRAAFQAMARNYKLCAERLAPPQPWARLVFSGGLAQRFQSLRAEIATRFDLPYRLCPTSEDTLLGLLALARVAAGDAPTVAASVAQLTQEVVVA